MKIQIIGFSGSGKSTFAKRLSEHFKIDVIHIDRLKFGPNWTERNDGYIENELNNFIALENWIVDGQYTRLAKSRFDSCDQLFLFEFNRIKCLYGVIIRFLKYRGKTRDSMGSGCQERWSWEFIKWVLKDGRTKKILERNQMYKEKYQDKIIIFKNRRQVNKYLQKIGCKL